MVELLKLCKIMWLIINILKQLIMLMKIISIVIKVDNIQGIIKYSMCWLVKYYYIKIIIILYNHL